VASQFADVQVTGVATGNSAPVDSALLPPPIVPPVTPPVDNPPVLPPQDMIPFLPPVDMTPPMPVTPPASGQCDPSNGRRVTPNSPYGRSLVSRGVQLVPCDDAPRPTGYTPRPTGYTPRPAGYTPRPAGYTPRPAGYTPRPAGYTPRPAGYTPRPAGYTPRPAGYTPRPAGYTPRPAGYTPRPAGYTPRPAGYTPRPAGYTPRPAGYTRPSNGGSRNGGMCDPSTGRRVNVNSAYGKSLVSRGVQFVNCAAAANHDDVNQYTDSSVVVPTPGWAIALIVLGSIVIVAMVVVMVQLFKLMRKY